jgi:hypothetical protein
MPQNAARSVASESDLSVYRRCNRSSEQEDDDRCRQPHARLSRSARS